MNSCRCTGLSLRIELNGADPKRGKRNQVAKLRSGCTAQGGTNHVLVFCPSEKLGSLWDYADVCCKYAHYERHESCSQQKFFEVFDGQEISQTTFVLDFGSKVLTIAAPKGLLCAVASERRRAKWKLKSESVGCGSAWKRLTGRTRNACSN